MKGSLRWLAVLLLGFGLLASPARAGDAFYVETEDLGEREAARAALERARAAGLDARLLHRYRRGEGWEYVLRIEVREDREAAETAGIALSHAAGVGVEVYLQAGRELLPVAEIAAPPGAAGEEEGAGDTGTGAEVPAGGEAPAGEGASPAEALDEEEAARRGAELLAALRRAHGSPGALAAVADAPRVHFRFERQVWGEDAVRAWHDYWRDGDRQSLEVRVLEGGGQDSRLLVSGSEARVEVGGEVQEVELAPSLEALSAFRPEAVLARALELPALEPEGEPLYRGELEEDGLLTDALLVPVGESLPPLLFRLDRSDHRVRSIEVQEEGGELLWRFSDYRELPGGLVVPFQWELWRGELRERITVLVLALPEEVPEEVFETGDFSSEDR